MPGTGLDEAAGLIVEATRTNRTAGDARGGQPAAQRRVRGTSTDGQPRGGPTGHRLRVPGPAASARAAGATVPVRSAGQEEEHVSHDKRIQAAIESGPGRASSIAGSSCGWPATPAARPVWLRSSPPAARLPPRRPARPPPRRPPPPHRPRPRPSPRRSRRAGPSRSATSARRPGRSPLSARPTTSSSAASRRRSAAGVNIGGHRPSDRDHRRRTPSPTRTARRRSPASSSRRRHRPDARRLDAGDDEPGGRQCEANGVPCISTRRPVAAVLLRPPEGSRQTPSRSSGRTTSSGASRTSSRSSSTCGARSRRTRRSARSVPNDGDGNAWGDAKLGFPPAFTAAGYTLVDPGRYGTERRPTTSRPRSASSRRPAWRS